MSDEERHQLSRVTAMADQIKAAIDEHWSDLIRISLHGPAGPEDHKLVRKVFLHYFSDMFMRQAERGDS